MGAVLSLEPLSGIFNIKEIHQYLMQVEGAVQFQDDHRYYSFLDDRWNIAIFTLSNLGDISHSANKAPFICISEAEIQVGINWVDTSSNNISNFLNWLLSRYPCKGQDGEGYNYKDSDGCIIWIKNWLPVD